MKLAYGYMVRLSSHCSIKKSVVHNHISQITSISSRLPICASPNSGHLHFLRLNLSSLAQSSQHNFLFIMRTSKLPSCISPSDSVMPIPSTDTGSISTAWAPSLQPSGGGGEALLTYVEFSKTTGDFCSPPPGDGDMVPA